MSEYYKGKLLLKRDINFGKIKFTCDENNIINIIKPNYNLSGAESQAIYNYISKFDMDKKIKIDDNISNIIINRITNKFFQTTLSEINIIYEKIETPDGTFAKEINTGFIFPLLALNNIDLTYSGIYKKEKKEIYGSISTNLKIRDCFETCKVYAYGDESVSKNTLEKYNKKKKIKKVYKKLENLFNQNTFKYNVEIKEPINITPEHLKKCDPYVDNSDELYSKPKIYKKIYKIN